jgi:hypothetical protein
MKISSPIRACIIAAMAGPATLILVGCGAGSDAAGGAASGAPGSGAASGISGATSRSGAASGIGGAISGSGGGQSISVSGGSSAGAAQASGAGGAESSGGASMGGVGGGAVGGVSGGAGSIAGAGGSAGTSSATSGSTVCPTPNCNPIFNGQDLSGWTQVPASPPQWSVVNGAMHSLASKRGYIYTAKSYGDFRFIFSLRQLQDPTPTHQPCVLFWGTSVTVDAMAALQVQPPVGYLWDYRMGRSVAPPSASHAGYKTPNTAWNRCEMLANSAAGTMRLACCPLPADGNGACTSKATEVVDFDAKSSQGPFVGTIAPLGLQIHTAGQIDEYKDLYVESPVAAPTTLLLLAQP